MAEQEKVFPKPVDWDELYPGRFIKAGDFRGGKPTLTMQDVEIKELVGDKGPQIKGVIRFKGKEKAWALNKTNGICLKAMFGRKVQDWVGKRVTLYAAPYEGEEAIRVWGSPEIAADMVVDIQLPRKRPFKMTMHRVDPKGPRPVPSPTTSGAPPRPDVATHIKRLREQQTVDDLLAVWQQITDEFDQAGIELPLDVEAVYTEMRESLGG